MFGFLYKEKLNYLVDIKLIGESIYILNQIPSYPIWFLQGYLCNYFYSLNFKQWIKAPVHEIFIFIIQLNIELKEDPLLLKIKLKILWKSKRMFLMKNTNRCS